MKRIPLLIFVALLVAACEDNIGTSSDVLPTSGMSVDAPSLGGPTGDEEPSYTLSLSASEDEHWPAAPYYPEFRIMVEEALAAYRPGDHFRWLSDGYSPTGQYLNYWHQKWGESETVQFDEEGIPQVKYDGVFYDHPVTLCRYALNLHGRIVRGEPELTEKFIKVVDRLLSLQDRKGAFLYPFPYRLYGHNFAPGWPSGMAQGMGLSVLRRAYDLTKDRKYLLPGNRAAYFFLRTREEGGVRTTLADLDPSLSGYVWLEEFATVPANYKLNGFMFTLFGLYDWWQRDPNATTGSIALAGDLFREGVKTVEATLHYFDMDGYTTTDLRYIVVPGTMPRMNQPYHRIHIFQLHTLAEITGSPVLKRYENLWRYYVEAPLGPW